MTDLGIGTTAPVNDLDQDFGYTGAGTIGDTIWLDLNGDGTLDAGEPGIPAATVSLIGAGADGILDTGDDLDYGTQTTGSDGTYLFENLPAGPFRVDVADLPTGVSNPTPTRTAEAMTRPRLTLPRRRRRSRPGLRVQRHPRASATRSGSTSTATGPRTRMNRGFLASTVTVTLARCRRRSRAPPTTFRSTSRPTPTASTSSTGCRRAPRSSRTTRPISASGSSRTRISTAATSPPRRSILDDGVDVRNVDFGVVGDASISGTVWIDLDNDGVQDPGEAGHSRRDRRRHVGRTERTSDDHGRHRRRRQLGHRRYSIG